MPLENLQEGKLILAIPGGPQVPGDPRYPEGSRLAIPTHRFLRIGCGYIYSMIEDQSYSEVEGDSVELAEFKDRDIPKVVAEARTRSSTVVGIVGMDHVLNLPSRLLWQVEVVRKLGFGTCDFQLGVRQGYGTENSTLEEVAGLRIATALPILAERIFRQRGIPANIVPMGGHVENAIRYGIADAIVDVTVSGDTMRTNGLIPAERLLEEPFQAALIANRDQLSDIGRQRQLNRLLTRVDRALRSPGTWFNPEGNHHPSENGFTSHVLPATTEQSPVVA